MLREIAQLNLALAGVHCWKILMFVPGVQCIELRCAKRGARRVDGLDQSGDGWRVEDSGHTHATFFLVLVNVRCCHQAGC